MRCHSMQPSSTPPQDRGPFGPELFREVKVALLGRNLDGERHEQHAPTHRFVDVFEPRLVVAGDEQLELRHKIKKVLPHETCGYLVAAGQGLDLGFVPAPSLLGFLGDDETVACSLATSVGWRSVVLAMNVPTSAIVR